jgi:beta-glucosidase
MTYQDIISKLSLDEKVQLVSGASAWRTVPIQGAGVPEMKVSDGPNGVRGDGGVAAASFPVGVCMASTWNLDLIKDVGDAIADEAKSKGVQVVLGPTINIHRGPLGGRNFECYSEDPYLSGMLASAFTDGVQAGGVAACVKHYVCNDSEFERHTISIEVDERTLREIYLRPFEIAIKRSNPWTIMGAYNRINGVYACSHDYLNNQVLKGEWGYDGLVISDWYAAKETVPNALGGLDLEMPGPAIAWGDKLRSAVDRGDVPETMLDDKVERLLRCMDRTGLLDDVKVTSELALDKPGHRKLAYQAAVEGMVLCKNEGLLPIDLAKKKKIAVIGPNVEDFRIMGGGSSSLLPHYVATPLQKLAAQFPDLEVETAKGCPTHKYVPETPKQQLSPTEGSNEKGLQYQFYRGGLAGELESERVVSRGTIMLQGLNESKRDSLIATGYFKAEETGDHTFGIFAAGKSRILVDDQVVVDNWTTTELGDAFFGQATTERQATMSLEAGKSYPIRIEYDADPASTFKAMRFGILGPDMEQCMTRALEIAKDADAVILLVGTNDDWETEGNDRESLSLPGEQDALIEHVVAVNPNTIVVNNSGSPVSMPWLDKVPAVIQTWFAGQEFGNALMDLITGAANPSGKLPITFPKRMVDTPAYTSYPGEFGKVYYGEGLFVGYRWYDARQIEPLLPFGFGLSYTRFEFSDLALIAEQDLVKVRCRVTNVGERAGKETVQVYVEPVSPDVARPVKELKAFAKVDLAPGESTDVEIELDHAAFAYWNIDHGDWFVSGGEYLVLVGNSSRDIHLSASFERQSPEMKKAEKTRPF